MGNNAVYERELLYPTENMLEPGSIHVQILNPNKRGKMPVIIESKTNHSPIKYIDSILRIMQTDIFDRILINVKNNVELYVKANGETSKVAEGKKYLLVSFLDEKVSFSGIDDIDC